MRLVINDKFIHEKFICACMCLFLKHQGVETHRWNWQQIRQYCHQISSILTFALCRDIKGDGFHEANLLCGWLILMEIITDKDNRPGNCCDHMARTTRFCFRTTFPVAT